GLSSQWKRLSTKSSNSTRLLGDRFSVHFVELHMLLKEAKRSGVSILASEGVGPLLVSTLIAVRNALVVDAKD
ncbi:TPA: hypothetical protein ACXM9F_007078, partial [Burkholderia cenocepacia]